MYAYCLTNDVQRRNFTYFLCILGTFFQGLFAVIVLYAAPFLLSSVALSGGRRRQAGKMFELRDGKNTFPFLLLAFLRAHFI